MYDEEEEEGNERTYKILGSLEILAIKNWRKRKLPFVPEVVVDDQTLHTSPLGKYLLNHIDTNNQMPLSIHRIRHGLFPLNYKEIKNKIKST